MAKKEINPNSDKDYIDKINLTNEKTFPKFLKSIQLSPFRHISDISLDFIHPISVIAGTNKSGKSTILMALACSHFDFKKRNIHNGLLERHTWSAIMQFTNQDKQKNDWTYYITYKLGNKEITKRGQRKADTKKWNGIGKKENQFKERQVIFIDLDRIYPARNFGRTIYSKSLNATLTHTDFSRVEKYLSYILEESVSLNKIASHLDKDIFKYSNSEEYSSYNAATGEEVLTKIIIDTIEAPEHSLILIDEIEVGLHPKLQRRLIQCLYNIARNDNKQFILTSHSPTILSSLPDEARIFIEKVSDGNYKAIPNINVNTALSRMDSVSYPLIDLFCEDSEAKMIIQKAISSIQHDEIFINFSDLVNIVISGNSDKTYRDFKSHQETYPQKRIKTGYACILDGDRRNLKNKENRLLYPPEECLHFIYSDYSPEKFLTEEYLKLNPNVTLTYHLNNSDSHCLFDKMVENSVCMTKEEAFNNCWSIFLDTDYGQAYFEELKNFLISMIEKKFP